jgi:arylformamidase
MSAWINDLSRRLMDPKVFRHYTQTELDRNYDQRAWAKNADEMFASCERRNAWVRDHLECHRDLAYGPGVDETLDWYSTKEVGAPVLVWIHGGAWRNFAKKDFAFVAPPFVESGVHVVIVNFSKAPTVRIAAMIDQVRRALAWVGDNAARFGGDPARLFIGGHSSGAHMAATAVLNETTSDASRIPTVRAAFCVSGSYDLEAVMLSARSNYLTMEGTEEDDLSPARHVDRSTTKVLIVYADNDTDEFKRHSREYAEALRTHGLLIDEVLLPNLNHFEINASLGDAQSPLSKLLVTQIAVSK